MRERQMRRVTFIVLILVGVIIMPPTTTGNQVADAAPPRFDLHGIPIVPKISGGVYSRARALVLRGKRKSNRVNVFSKIGDSITAWNFFLTTVGGAQLGDY